MGAARVLACFDSVLLLKVIGFFRVDERHELLFLVLNVSRGHVLCCWRRDEVHNAGKGLRLKANDAVSSTLFVRYPGINIMCLSLAVGA